MSTDSIETRIAAFVAADHSDTIEARRKAAKRAREILAEPGPFDEERLRELMRELNQDSQGGQPTRRYGPVLTNMLLPNFLKDLERFNTWTFKLWDGSDDEVLEALDAITKDRSVLPLAGRLWPSLLLHLRDPSRFVVWYEAVDKALRRVSNYPGSKRRQGKVGYLAFCEAAQTFARDNSVEPELIETALLAVSERPSVASEVEEPGDEEDAIEAGLASPTLFSDTTFELLDGLLEAGTQAYYQQHKAGLIEHVQLPLNQLLRDVAEHLTDDMTARLETMNRLFSRIPKNDWGKGGAWPYYWGAFYTKGGKRISDAQLFTFIDSSGLDVGFYIGEHGLASRDRFARNAQSHIDALLDRLAEPLADAHLTFGERKEATGWPSDSFRPSLQEWLKNSGSAARIGRVIPPDELLSLSWNDLVRLVVDLFRLLYPFVLLTQSSAPLVEIDEFLSTEEDDDTTTSAAPYTLTELATETSMSPALLERWIEAIRRKGQAVLYGPPGTGKTFMAVRLGRHLIGGTDGFIDSLQFHPSYAYEEFIEGIRPIVRPDGQLTYDLVPGRFLDFCSRASKRTGECVLILDEINRANIARVFGELMYLLEYRDTRISLVSGRPFAIPNNVRLIGTMNTADRSIALVDHALRRRFAFLGLYPDYDILRSYHASTGFPIDQLVLILKQVNAAIGERAYEVGVSYFLRVDLASSIANIWTMEIEPYLEEFFYDRPATLEGFRWDALRSTLEAT